MSDYSIKWYGQKVFTLATEANVAAMEQAAILVENDIKRSMTLTPRMPFRISKLTGKPITSRGRRGHHPSAVGFPPAVDQGHLRAGVDHVVKKDGLGINGFVGIKAGVKYGLYQELGTRNMAARPFLRPALIRNAKKILNIFKRTNAN